MTVILLTIYIYIHTYIHNTYIVVYRCSIHGITSIVWT